MDHFGLAGDEIGDGAAKAGIEPGDVITAFNGQKINSREELPPLVGPLPAGSKVFHAGTRFDGDGNVVTSGGRVLCACALGDTVADAQRAAYAAVEKLNWDGEFHRSDIGWRAVGRS